MKFTTRSRATALAVACAAFTVQTAQAHGDAKPQHGGIVQSTQDVTLELVEQPGGAAVFLEDHGKPMAVAGATGKITVLTGGKKAEAELQPAGDKLEAKGIALGAGSKVVVSVTMADKKVLTVRFVEK